MTAIEPKTFRWRLRVMMAERGINTVTELRRRLEPLGIEISTQQLNRVVSEMPQRLNTDLLAALITVLKCTPNDLLHVDVVSGAQPRQSGTPSGTATPVKKRISAPGTATSTVSEEGENLVGPKVTPFPLPEQKRKE